MGKSQALKSHEAMNTRAARSLGYICIIGPIIIIIITTTTTTPTLACKSSG